MYSRRIDITGSRDLEGLLEKNVGLWKAKKRKIWGFGGKVRKKKVTIRALASRANNRFFK